MHLPLGRIVLLRCIPCACQCIPAACSCALLARTEEFDQFSQLLVAVFPVLTVCYRPLGLHEGMSFCLYTLVYR
jgi:hypothetical protein